MLAGIRQIAYGLAMVMVAFLAVTVAYTTLWVAFLGTNALLLFQMQTMFYDPWIETAYLAPADARSLVSLAVVIWLIGYAIRRVAKSMSSGRRA